MISRRSSRSFVAVMAVVMVLTLVLAPAASAANQNPGIIPNQGPKYGELSIKWWQWAASFPIGAADNPLTQEGPVNISRHQSGQVWFLAGAAGYASDANVRVGTVPAGKSLFFPLANIAQDYPCPWEGYEPQPNETMEQFLAREANTFWDGYGPTNYYAEIDGHALKINASYRAQSHLAYFQLFPYPASLNWDPCATEDAQPFVSLGYWILLTPLTPGKHILHFGANGGGDGVNWQWGQDITYKLTVK